MMKSTLLMSSSRGAVQRAPCAPQRKMHAGAIIAPRLAPTPTGQCVTRKSVSMNSAANQATTVKLNIQGRKLEVTEAIKEYLESKLLKAAGNGKAIITRIDVTLSARGGDTGTLGKKLQKVEVTLNTKRNGVVRVEDVEENLYAAIDKVCDKVERKLQKVKDIAINKGKWPGRAGAHGSDVEDYKEFVNEVIYEVKVGEEQSAKDKDMAKLNALYPQTQVMRSKNVDLTAMSVEDAIEALEAVGHAFYLYLDETSGEIQVVYRRDAGGYGVLNPRK